MERNAASINVHLLLHCEIRMFPSSQIRSTQQTISDKTSEEKRLHPARKVKHNATSYFPNCRQSQLHPNEISWPFFTLQVGVFD
jgi:hypothetical protein